MNKKKNKQPENIDMENNLGQRVSELENQLKRALADYQNLLKRIDQRRANWRSRAKASVIDKMLDVLDDLRRAQKHLNDKGLNMAVQQFWAALESEGVEEIKTQNREFDADLMDCAEVVEGPENEVVETIKSGYLLNKEVIRPAKVKVGQGKENKNE